MNVFDIIGPIMVGPSSSHTAGAVRIGRMVRSILGNQPVKALIQLHGSFAQTYKGHGTDRALLAGLMGFNTDDLRIRQSLELAKQAGLEFVLESVDLGDAHPNTAKIIAWDNAGNCVTVVGSSVGGGNIIIKQVNGFNVEFTGTYSTLILPHKDAPGAVAAVTGLLAKHNINIAQMKLYRSHKGGKAMMILETDQKVNVIDLKRIGQIPQINDVMLIEPNK